MKFGVVIAAAGRGTRMESSEKKQFIEMQGKPVLYYSVRLFTQIPAVREIIVVTSQEDVERTQVLLQEWALPNVTVIAGGKERQQSVHLGLQALKQAEYVMIHDAARPFVSEDLIQQIMTKALETQAAIPAVPVKDTIKIVSDSGEVISTPSRQSLWAVQTPQAFRLSLILELHLEAEKAGFLGTDDAMLMEWKHKKVHVVPGDYTNIKLTTPDDLRWGELILRKGNDCV